MLATGKDTLLRMEAYAGCGRASLSFSTLPFCFGTIPAERKQSGKFYDEGKVRPTMPWSYTVHIMLVVVFILTHHRTRNGMVTVTEQSENFVQEVDQFQSCFHFFKLVSVDIFFMINSSQDCFSPWSFLFWSL